MQAASEGIKVAFEVQKGAIILLQKALRIRGVQLGVSYFSHQENADFMRYTMVFSNPSVPPVSLIQCALRAHLYFYPPTFRHGNWLMPA